MAKPDYPTTDSSLATNVGLDNLIKLASSKASLEKLSEHSSGGILVGDGKGNELFLRDFDLRHPNGNYSLNTPLVLSLHRTNTFRDCLAKEIWNKIYFVYDGIVWVAKIPFGIVFKIWWICIMSRFTKGNLGFYIPPLVATIYHFECELKDCFVTRDKNGKVTKRMKENIELASQHNVASPATQKEQ